MFKDINYDGAFKAMIEVTAIKALFLPIRLLWYQASCKGKKIIFDRIHIPDYLKAYLSVLIAKY